MTARGGILGVPMGAFAGGLLGIFAGVLEIISAYLIIYASFLVGRSGWSGPGGAGVASLLYLSLPAGLLILIGSSLVILRRYLAGGIMMLIVGALFPFRVAPIVLMILLGIETSTHQLAAAIFNFFFIALPIAGGILALVFGTRQVK
jgi:hypothetical protein